MRQSSLYALLGLFALAALAPATGAGCTRSTSAPTRPSAKTGASPAGAGGAGAGGQVSGIPAPQTGGGPAAGGATAAGGAASSTGGDPAAGGATTSSVDASSAGGAGAGAGGSSANVASSSGGASVGSGGAAPCAIGHVVLGEVRTRGAGGASDEFVALFNATAAPVTLDDAWQLSVRGASDATYRAHWTGAGRTLAPWGHFLIAGTGYAEAPSPDARLSSGITDAASLRLVHAGVTVDALCFGYDHATMTAFDATFTCEGAIASNLPHDDTASATSDTDVSLARKPGGPGGGCADTGNSAADFVNAKPATPESTASAPTP